mgnify:CR=1 FL=1
MASLGEEPEFTSSAASLKESVILFSDSLLSPCVAIGFGLAVIFVAMLVAFDIANLRHLVLETEMGWLAAMMMVLFNGVVFAGAQFANLKWPVAVKGKAQVTIRVDNPA